jgi:hypothetical protein
MKEKKKSGLSTKSSTSLIKETGRKYNKADHEKRRQLDREFEEGGWKNEIALAKRAIFDSTNLDQCLGIIMPFARVLRRGSYCERLIIERLILLSQEEKKLDQISKEFMVYRAVRISENSSEEELRIPKGFRDKIWNPFFFVYRPHPKTRQWSFFMLKLRSNR